MPDVAARYLLLLRLWAISGPAQSRPTGPTPVYHTSHNVGPRREKGWLIRSVSEATMKFTGICPITKNVPALIDFYSRVLGVVGEGDDTHAELKTEGAQLAIFSMDGMESLAPSSMDGCGYGSFTLGFEVTDVDAEYEHLKALGVCFVKLPTTHPWGARSVWFRDPDGNIVDFFAILPRG
jgi:catechol 2,3-dioxygenase-like lactoylglutathione lyase family enzyme